MGLVIKNPPANAGDVGLILGKITWRSTWQPTPVFLPGESTDRGDWQATVHSMPKSWTRLKQLSTRAHTNGKDLVLFYNTAMAQVQSLVTELRSCKPHCTV